MRVASPAELCAGSGNSTCRPSPVAGPPTRWGRRNCQPTSVPKAGICAATDRGITIMSGDLATVTPVGWTSCAPAGELRATLTQSEESGIQASNPAWPDGELSPDTAAAAAEGCSLITCTTAQCPSTLMRCALKYLLTCLIAGATSSAAARLTTTG